MSPRRLRAAVQLGMLASEVCEIASNGIAFPSSREYSAAIYEDFERPGSRLPIQALREIQLLTVGVVDLSRILLPPNSLAAFEQLMDKNLVYAISPLAVAGDRSGYTEYSAWSPIGTHSEDLLCVWAGSSEESVLRGLVLDLLGDHRGVGSALSYPPCCVSAYIAGSTKEWRPGQSWACAPFWRFGGCPLLAHFPCSGDCLASINVARNRLNAMAREALSTVGLERDKWIDVLSSANGQVLWCLEDQIVGYGPSSLFAAGSNSWPPEFRIAVPEALIELIMM